MSDSRLEEATKFLPQKLPLYTEYEILPETHANFHLVSSGF